MICKKCGNEIKESDKFCIKCGEPVEINNSLHKISKKKIIIPVVAVCVILLIAIIIAASNSSKDNSSNFDSNNFQYNNDYIETEDTTEATTQNSKATVNNDGTINNSELAKSQQKIIATALDNNGDIYEIIGNVSESYQGSELLIGVIKNSEWLIEPNNNCPYINEERWGWDKSGSDIESLNCGYLSNGTFYNLRKGSSATPVYEGYLELWNVETDKYLYLEDTSSDYSLEDYSELDTRKTDTFVFVTSVIHGINDRSTLCFLNTKTLEVNELYEVITQGSVICHQISDGLFYTSIDMPNKVRIGTFYDENANKVFDLKEFDTDKTDIVVVGDFVDGKCEIVNELENGTRYKIVIDKTGKAISNEKISN